MAERYLIDTSAIIKYLNETFTKGGISFIDIVVDNESNISFIVEIELQSWVPPSPDDLINYQLFVQGSNVIGINNAIIEETINIRKKHKLKIPDAIIAATAIVNQMTLIADNDKDFKKVTNLKYLNPNTI